MHPIYAALAIARAKQKKTELIPIMFEDVNGTGLKVFRVTYNRDGKPLFAHVNRLAYIAYLESKNQLIKKRTAIRNVLRDCIRKS